MCSDITSHSPHSKSCPFLLQTAFAINWSFLHPAIVCWRRWIFAGKLFVCPSLGFAHYRLPLQKQWKAPHSQLNFSVSVRNEDMSINNSWRVSKIQSSPEHLQTPMWLHFGLHTAFLHLHAVFLLSAPCASSRSTVPPGTVITGDTLSSITKMHLHIMLASYIAPYDN